jgi:protease-4
MAPRIHQHIEVLVRMSVLRFIRRLIVGLFAIIGAFVVLVIVVSAVTVAFFPGVRHEVPDNAVLTLDLADGISERGPTGPLAWASFSREISIRSVVEGLEFAGRDDRVRGLVARLAVGDLPMARAQEIRDAILAFRQQGKFAIAFTETFGEAGNGNTNYYLATAFDEIWLQPSGDVGLTGVRLESPYLKAALDSIGVSARISQREEYKGVMDPLTNTEMPGPVRENFQRLADSWVAQLAEGIAQGRNIERDVARGLIDRGPFLAEEAVNAKLVDRLGYWDEVEAAVDERAEASERMSLASYAASLRPPRDAARIALVYGLGPVQLTSGAPDPLFEPAVMESGKVSRAIRDATDDPDVRAIIFRVDSPGGSYVASDTIWRQVERARTQGKPVIVTMGDVAASGGYFIAAPANQIVAQPGTITGSIGVVGGKVVLSDMWANLDIAWDGVQAGANADMNSPNRDYSRYGWNRLQVALDRIYADFLAKVAAGREMTPEQVRAVAGGQVWTGSDARANGLVDDLGGYATALRLARAAAGIPEDAAVELVEFPRAERGLAGLLRRFSGGEVTPEAVRLARLVELLEPLARVLAPVLDGPAAANLRMAVPDRTD